jgi:hypothetical protein
MFRPSSFYEKHIELLSIKQRNQLINYKNEISPSIIEK